MPIPNASPVTPAACNQYWVSSITLSTPLVSATLRPSDGTNVLANRSLSKRIVADTTKDATAASLVAALFAAIQNLAAKNAAVQSVSVFECDPTSPVQVSCVFADSSVYRIPDLFALLASNTAAASAYANVISYLTGKL